MPFDAEETLIYAYKFLRKFVGGEDYEEGTDPAYLESIVQKMADEFDKQ